MAFPVVEASKVSCREISDGDLRTYRSPQSIPSSDGFKNRQQYGAAVQEIENATKLDFFPYGNLIVHLEAPQWKRR